MAMIRSAPICLAERTPRRPTAPSPTTATVLPGPAWAESAAYQPVPSTSEAASRCGIRSASGRPWVATRVPSAFGTRSSSAWALPTNSRCTQCDWYPARQISQVLSEVAKEPTTNWPTWTFSTSAPTRSTTPTYSCPIGCGSAHRLDAAIGPQVGPADAGRAQPG